MNNLYQVSVGLKGVHTALAQKSRLQIAYMVALGLSHVHSIDGEGNATLAHYDINPRNVIIMGNGRPNINDFNVAEFLSWDPSSGAPCGFEGRLHEPWWRAPEEMVSSALGSDEGASLQRTRLTEKVDVYSMGNVLFVLLTGTEPRGKENKKVRFQSVSNAIARGDLPVIADKYAKSTDPVTVALLRAIMKCWEPNPILRSSSADIASELYSSLKEIKTHPTYKDLRLG